MIIEYNSPVNQIMFIRSGLYFFIDNRSCVRPVPGTNLEPLG